MVETPPVMHHDPEVAAEMAAASVHRYLKECGVVGREERRAWIAKVFERVRAGEDRAN